MCCLVVPLLNQESRFWIIRQAQTAHYQVLQMMQLSALQNKLCVYIYNIHIYTHVYIIYTYIIYTYIYIYILKKCLLIHHAINSKVWNSLDSWKYDYLL